MDRMSIIGLSLVAAAIVFSTMLDGNSLTPLFGPSSLLLVVLGTFGAVLAGLRLVDAKQLPKAAKVAFTAEGADPDVVVTQLMEFADVARRDGILSLEERLPAVEDDFQRSGLQMVVDGEEGDTVREILELEIGSMEDRHLHVIGAFRRFVDMAPTFGMIGTIIGLVNILGNLDSPDALGSGMALALLTTLYGVFIANVVFAPIANKLERLHALEVAARELALEGILAVREGASPRLLVDRLEAYLDPQLRVGAKARKDARQQESDQNSQAA